MSRTRQHVKCCGLNEFSKELISEIRSGSMKYVDELLSGDSSKQELFCSKLEKLIFDSEIEACSVCVSTMWYYRFGSDGATRLGALSLDKVKKIPNRNLRNLLCDLCNIEFQALAKLALYEIEKLPNNIFSGEKSL